MQAGHRHSAYDDPDLYWWSSTEFLRGDVWAFVFDLGIQNHGSGSSDGGFALAVRDGDVGASVVPIRAAGE